MGNLDADSLADMVADCARFWIDNATLIRQAMEFNPDYSLSQAGGDYWYTRNGHGVGYWDRGLDVIGDALTTAAQHNESGLWAAPLDPETGNPLPGYHCDHDAPSDATPDPDDSELWRVYTDSRVDPLTPDESAALAKLTGETAPDLPQVGNAAGAPMGRRSTGIQAGESCNVYPVTLDPGGYDAGGAYWGLGESLWRVIGQTSQGVEYVRAKDRGAALAIAQPDSPDALPLFMLCNRMAGPDLDPGRHEYLILNHLGETLETLHLTPDAARGRVERDGLETIAAIHLSALWSKPGGRWNQNETTKTESI